MIEKLRKKFIVISVVSVFIVLSVISAAICISNYMGINNHADNILEIIATNDGHFPKPKNHKPFQKEMSPEAPFSTRFFTVTANKKGNILSVDTGKIAAISTKDATEYAQKILQGQKNTGFIGVYKYLVQEKQNKTMIVFLDCRHDLEMFKSLIISSVFISVVGIFSVFTLVVIISKYAIKPVAESYEKQKQFVTDASHELKTPLAIIKTNSEVLEMEYGENQWTNNVNNQIDRMSQLVSELVCLAKMDEEVSQLQMTDFSLSDAVEETSNPFLALANLNSKTLITHIEKNLSYYGNEQTIRQLVSVLLDNAVKYASHNSKIKLSLKKHGKKYHISVFNMADNLDVGNLDVLFERFYRTDLSRNSQTGGYGIGLSIAKAIALKHKGKIKAESHDGKSLLITVII